jgi:catechol 2,3-dioxygenase-like lactoylglutathione lyase family enzyme
MVSAGASLDLTGGGSPTYVGRFSGTGAGHVLLAAGSILECVIPVDDLKAALARLRQAGFPIEYGPADEPWGVRRFYVRDPFGTLVNILVHA